MRLDHVSYVASHDQISDVVNRIGSQIGTAFIDGGIHPKFGTRNFTAPLLNGHYIEVVCPLDHPATETTPFGQAVKKKAEAGGGWLSWVISTSNITELESSYGRNAIIGQRKKPNGEELTWKQLGVIPTLEDPAVPFYVQWISKNHPSRDGHPNAVISTINISADKEKIFKMVDVRKLEKNQEFSLFWLNPKDNEGITGITSIEFEVNSNKVLLQ